MPVARLLKFQLAYKCKLQIHVLLQLNPNSTQNFEVFIKMTENSGTYHASSRFLSVISYHDNKYSPIMSVIAKELIQTDQT